ncbi:MAG: hypothetical protein IPQ05_05345 [Leptospiraceae bacterium]|nr:hypothetical protein [Leptospiraceae bacterium]
MSNNDISTIRSFYDLSKHHKNSSEILSQLYEQIDDHALIERAISGFKTEDLFFDLFSVMPWIKLLHKLDEKPLPESSRDKYQIPDFLCLYENYESVNLPLHVEVKTVNKNKIKLDNIMKIQFENSLNYCKSLNISLVYAIYWKKFHFWTINTYDSFIEKKKKLEIPLLTSYGQDISLILGDLTYYISNNFYRISYYRRGDEGNIIDNKYGGLVKDKINHEDTEYDLTPYESGIISSIVRLKEEKRNQVDNNTLEVFRKPISPITMKLSTMIILFLSKQNIPINHQSCHNALFTILELFKKLNIKQYFIVPNKRTSASDSIIEKSFNKHFFSKYIELNNTNQNKEVLV